MPSTPTKQGDTPNRAAQPPPSPGKSYLSVQLFGSTVSAFHLCGVRAFGASGAFGRVGSEFGRASRPKVATVEEALADAVSFGISHVVYRLGAHGGEGLYRGGRRKALLPSKELPCQEALCAPGCVLTRCWQPRFVSCCSLFLCILSKSCARHPRGLSVREARV